MRPFKLTWAVLALAIVAFAGGIMPRSAPARAEPAITLQEAHDIAAEAFVCFYPLVSMDITRRQLTNVEPGKMTGRGPMNTFTPLRLS